MLRLFAGIALTTEIKRRLHEEVHEMGIPGRIIPDFNMHITIKFLGNCDESIAVKIEDILGRVARGHEPFKIKIGGFGAFPSLAKPRVAWIGVNEGGDLLSHLAQEANYRLKELFEPSKFSPHITVARYKKPENLKELASKYSRIEIGEMTVDKMTLFQSKLSSAGAEYSPYKEFLLKA